jgi:hypothetical protein
LRANNLINVLIENDGNSWQATSKDLTNWVAWSDSLTNLRQLISEGVEYCLESTDFTIEEQFDSSIQVEQ